MTTILPIHDLAEQLHAQFPSAIISLRRPKGAGKTWWLDLRLGPTEAEIEWNPSRGFGISVNSESVFGAQSDELYSSSTAVRSRLVDLINSGKKTEDSSETFVRALREARKLTQTQLAKILDIKQASISRLETRDDFHVSTLRNIISRLGGQLELRATFPDGSVHIMQYKARENDKNSARSSVAKRSIVQSSRTKTPKKRRGAA